MLKVMGGGDQIPCRLQKVRIGGALRREEWCREYCGRKRSMEGG